MENFLGRKIHDALCCYLRIQEEGVYDFDITDPVPEKDPEYGVKNEGFFEIFNAAKHDIDFKRSGEIDKPKDAVADGNEKVTRIVMEDEKKFKKKYKKKGRPVVNKKDRRCQHVKKVAEIKEKRTRIGGIWVTMDMKKRGQEGALNAVLH